jgi:hypothetical protein
MGGGGARQESHFFRLLSREDRNAADRNEQACRQAGRQAGLHANRQVKTGRRGAWMSSKDRLRYKSPHPRALRKTNK